MEFPGLTVRGLGGNEISLWGEQQIRAMTKEDESAFSKIVDAFGKRSAVAQALKAPITDIAKLKTSGQRLYFQATRQGGTTTVLGGIKVGKKKLFIRKVDASIHEIEPLCVLDFYVHQEYQRKGVGKALFEHMLAAEQIEAGSLAYDRPSPKLLPFLHRHYGLKEYVPQTNSYVLFDTYFHLNPAHSRRGGSGREARDTSNPLAGGESSYRSASVGRRGTPSQVTPPWGVTSSTAAAGAGTPHSATPPKPRDASSTPRMHYGTTPSPSSPYGYGQPPLPRPHAASSPAYPSASAAYPSASAGYPPASATYPLASAGYSPASAAYPSASYGGPTSPQVQAMIGGDRGSYGVSQPGDDRGSYGGAPMGGGRGSYGVSQPGGDRGSYVGPPMGGRYGGPPGMPPSPSPGFGVQRTLSSRSPHAALTPTGPPNMGDVRDIGSTGMRSKSLERPSPLYHHDALDGFKHEHSAKPPSASGGAAPKYSCTPPWGGDTQGGSAQKGTPPSRPSIYQTVTPWASGEGGPGEGGAAPLRRFSSPALSPGVPPPLISPYAHVEYASNGVPIRGKKSGAPPGLGVGAESPQQNGSKQRSGSGAAGCMVW